MGRNVFLSFLGAGAYKEVEYLPLPHRGGEQPHRTPYIQEARLKALAERGVRLDEAWVFTTPSAACRHWASADDRRLEARGEPLGLRRLPIDDPTSVANTWRIFEALSDRLQPGDRLYLDVTHGFRTLPLLLVAALDLAVALKDVSVVEMTYGAFEVLPKEDDSPRPTWDLLPLRDVSAWAAAVSVFRSSGDLAPLLGAVERTIDAPAAAAEPAIRDAMQSFKDAADALSDALERVDVRRLARAARGLIDQLAALGQVVTVDAAQPDATRSDSDGERFFAPLALVLPALSESLKPLAGGDSDLRGQLEAAGWFAEKRRLTSAATMLRETMVDLLAVIAAGFGHADVDREDLDGPQGWFGLLAARGGPQPDAQPRDSASEVVIELAQRWEQGLDDRRRAFQTLAQQVSSLRNALDHGWTSPKHDGLARDAAHARARLRSQVEQIRELLVAWGADGSASPAATTAAPTAAADGGERFFVLMNHTLTDAQWADAQASLGVSRQELPTDELRATWAQIPPEDDAKVIGRVLGQVMQWVTRTGNSGDFVMVQGDPGATYRVVGALEARGFPCVYSTTARVSEDAPLADGAVRTSKVFRHVRFRRYVASR